jgi:hypothetical protein
LYLFECTSNVREGTAISFQPPGVTFLKNIGAGKTEAYLNKLPVPSINIKLCRPNNIRHKI